MRIVWALAFSAAMVAIAGDAMAATVEQAARGSARRRGYSAEQTRCFVPIFARYASLNRYGRWAVPGGRRGGDVYRHEVYTQCGVIR